MSRYLRRASRALAILIVVAFVTYGLPAALVVEPVVENAAAAELLVRCGWLSDILVWNPMNLEMVEDYVACFLIYSALITYDEDWNVLEGDLARSWSFVTMDNGTAADPSDDYLVASIELTENAYWRNLATLDDTSHPVTANDVKFTFDMIISENKGAWPLYMKGIEEIRVIDDYNLEIETNYLKATLLEDLSMIPIVPEYLWSTYSQPCTATMKPDQLVGSGPMVFDSMLSASWWKFVTAPNYHMTTDFGEDADIDYDGVLFTMHGGAIELAMAMNAGEEDCIVMTGEPNLYNTVLGDDSVSTIIKSAVQENGITDVALNAIPFENRTTTGGGYGDGFELLVDPILREAILMCMDKTFICEEIMWGLASPANSVVQPGYWHIDPTPEILFDPAAAKDLLMANGYADEDDNNYLECRVTDPEDWRSEFYGVELSGIRCQVPNTDPSYLQVAELWEDDASDAGIGLVAEEKSEGVMVSSAWYKADYDIWVWHWGWGPEPLSTLSCWLTETMVSGGDNCQMPMGPYEDYVDAELGLDLTYTYNGSIYDQVWDIAAQTMNMEDRRELVFLLQQWVYDSRCEYPPFYDVGLYGYTESTFTNWGDWEAHNGQNFVSGLPWLWFDLEPAANTPPQVNIDLQESYEVLAGESETFEIEIYDAQGDTIWANWSFGDGSDDVELKNEDDTSEIPWSISVSHTYETVESDLTLEVVITDGFSGHSVILTADVDVVSEYDGVPVISAVSSDSMSTAYTGQVVTWTATFQDPEAESLKVTWNWDDYTYTIVDLEPTSIGAAVVNEQTHIWDEVGTYDVVISVWDGYGEEDGMHNQSTGDTDNRINVIVNTAPEDPAVSEISTMEGVETPCLAVTSDFDADVITVTWEWDDGSFDVTTHDTSDAQGVPVMSNVAHTWDSSGSYTVTVWADDGILGHNVSTEVTAEVAADGSDVAPSSLLIVMDPSPPLVGGTTVLTAYAFDANGDAIAFTVDFGDDSDLAFDDASVGSVDLQSAAFEHVYEEVGDVTVTLYAYDGTDNISASFDFEVVETPENSPPTLGLQTSYTAMYNQTFTITPTSVSDSDGDDVTVWYDWGDESAKTEGDADNNYAASHEYSATGTFTLIASVDDGTGMENHNVSKTAEVVVSEANFRPKFQLLVKEPVKNLYAPDEMIYINITVSDFEGDAITVTVGFGDGSDNVTRTLDAAGPGENVTTSFEHAYAEAGEYTITIVIKDDYEHSLAWNSRTVNVEVVSETKGSNALLYAGVGLLLVIVIVAALMLMKRKKKGVSDTDGMSGMEGMAPVEETPPPPGESS
jgi:ABC-type oligopeptide transport system substrate-binding subunit